VTDHETWILNTTESNANNAPVFEKLYSAKEAYGLASLRLDDLYDFVIRMITDDDLFLKFERYLFFLFMTFYDANILDAILMAFALYLRPPTMNNENLK